MSPSPPVLPGGDTIPSLSGSRGPSSLNKLKAAKALDERLNVPDHGDPNHRPFPLPRRADPLRTLSTDTEELEAASSATAQVEPARRLLEAEDLEEHLRELLEHCVSTLQRPSRPDDAVPAPRRAEGEEPDRFGEADEPLEAQVKFIPVSNGDKRWWRCHFCEKRVDTGSDSDDSEGEDEKPQKDEKQQQKFIDKRGTPCCQACVQRVQAGEPTHSAAQKTEDPWDAWDGAEFRRRSEAVLWRWGEGDGGDVVVLGEAPFWETFPLTALREDEAAQSGSPPPRRRRCSEERRNKLFMRLAIPGNLRESDEEYMRKYCSVEKQEGTFRKGLEVHTAFVVASKAAIAALREVAASGEERPVAVRPVQEPDQLGWATASSKALKEPPDNWRRPQKKKWRKTKPRFEVSEEFLQSLQKAQEELESLASSGVVSQKRPVREIPKALADLLTAPSKKELLAKAMSASSKKVYVGEDVEELELSTEGTGSEEKFTKGCTFSKLCSQFVRASTVVRGGPFQSSMYSKGISPFQPLSTLGPGEHDLPSDRRWFHHFRAVELPVDPTETDSRRKVLLAESVAGAQAKVFLDLHSQAYDGSVDPELFPVMRLVNAFRRIFRISANVWDFHLEQDQAQEKGSRPTTPGKVDSPGQRKPPPPGPKKPESFYGVRLGDVQALVESNRAWFEEERWCKFSERNKKKTMYDVCPELIIPATTCQERIVVLREEDMPKLTTRFDDPPGIFFSNVDLTIDPALGSVRLGGQEIPSGLTFHGKLVRDGPIRRDYWMMGPERDAKWRTLPFHGRDPSPLHSVAPLPKELLQSGGPIGEATDRVWRASDLEVGDICVLRRGVSFIDMVAGDGPKSELDSFASHFWGEETVDFLRTLVRHAEALESQGGIKASNRTYYICTFNNNQHRVELGSSWMTSPFNKALEFVAGMMKLDPGSPRDAVMVFDSEAKPLQRKWCVFEAWRCTELELPLRLYCPDGEITRNTVNKSRTAEEVLRMVSEIDVATAGCSVKSDADMINRAIEDAPGGFAAVHAKLRTRVLDLMTFIGSLAVSVDPMTGRKVEEVELHVRGRFPESVSGKMLPARDIAVDMCTPGAALGRNVLLVAPAGSGKSVFSRALVRHAVEVSRRNVEEGKPEVLPVRVPLAEMAKAVQLQRNRNKKSQKNLAIAFARGMMSQAVFDKRYQELEEPDFSNLFDDWAKRAFLRDSDDVVSDQPNRHRLLILDGFDEAGHCRAEIITWLRRYVEAHPAVRTLLTTRPSGLDNVGMSTGRARTVRKGTIFHVDVDAGLVSINEDYPPKTLVEVEMQDQEKTCCVVESAAFMLPRSDVIGQIRPSWDTLKAQGDNTAVENAFCLTPTQFSDNWEVELLPVEPGVGVGTARGIVQVLDERTVNKNIRRAKEAKRLEADYQVTMSDIISVRVTKAAQGHKVGGFVKIAKENLARQDKAEVDARLAKARKDSDEAQRAGDQAKRTILESRVVELDHLRRRLDKTREEGMDVVLKVMQDLRYVRLAAIDTERPLAFNRIKQGGQAEEMLVRSQLTRELGFSDFEVDTISAPAAAAIARNVGGGALRGFDEGMLHQFAPNLWERPLMANLFGQYLQNEGVSRTMELSSSVAELEIFRFITEKLIRQAASVVAPNSRQETLAAEFERIYALLMETSRQKMNRNERLWHKANLRYLYEDAIRGHFRLFEPQEGNESARPVQMYHYRIQELLAAEAWNKSGLSIERASRNMVRRDNLVATGLAPLKFLVQAKLSQQMDPQTLSLDYLNDGETRSCDSRLVTNLGSWLPPTLESLEMQLPPLHDKENTAVKKDFVDIEEGFRNTLPSSLRVCKLNFHACKVNDEGLLHMGFYRLERLQSLELNLNQCNKVTDWGLTVVASQLPAGLQELKLEARSMRSEPRLKMNLKWPDGVDSNGYAGTYTLGGVVGEPDERRSFYLRDAGEGSADACIVYHEDHWHVMPGSDPQAAITALDEGTRGIQALAHIGFEIEDGLPPDPSDVPCWVLGPLERRDSDSEPAEDEAPEGDGEVDDEEKQDEESNKEGDEEGNDEDGEGSVQKEDNEEKEDNGDDDDEEEQENSKRVMKVMVDENSKRVMKVMVDDEDEEDEEDEGNKDSESEESGEEFGSPWRRNYHQPDPTQIPVKSCSRRPALRVFGQLLPKKLQTLHLNISATQVDDNGLAELGASLPRDLKEFDLQVQACKNIEKDGPSRLCENLPPALKRLRLDVRLSLKVTDLGERLGEKLPRSLEAFELVCNRKVTDESVAGLSSQLPDLKHLTLDLRRSPLTDTGLVSLGKNLPPGLLSLNLSCELCRMVSSGAGDVCRSLPRTLKDLSLDFEMCRLLGEDSLELLGANLPPGLRSLDLDVASCKRLRGEGLGAACRQLPPSLRRLRIAAAGLDQMDHGLFALGSGAPKGLEALELDVSRSCIASSSVIGLCEKLPSGLKSLHLVFKRCQQLNDEVLRLHLHPQLASLTLDFSYCHAISDQGLSKLAATLLEQTPRSRADAQLKLIFHECEKVTSVGLKAVQDAATRSPDLLTINFDRKTLSGRRGRR